MKQVKIFTGRATKIEDDINKWIEENTNYDIIDVKMIRSDVFFYVLIVYDNNKK